jgi:predicted transcriptional regulator
MKWIGFLRRSVPEGRKEMPLTNCIRTDVVTASSDQCVGAIMRMMDERNVGSVVNEDEG